MYYFFPDEDGTVCGIYEGEPLPGAVAAGAIPSVPDVPDGQMAVRKWDGEKLYYVFEPLPPMSEPQPEGPTKAEQESRRASAYRERVDPITCEIQRLRDMGGTEKEIAEAEQRRAEAVRAIKEELPYPASAGETKTTAQDKPLPTLY